MTALRKPMLSSIREPTNKTMLAFLYLSCFSVSNISVQAKHNIEPAIKKVPGGSM